MKTNIYTRKEKSELFKRLVPFLASHLKNLKATRFTYKEMIDLTGIPQNRMSDLVNMRYFNEGILIQLLGGGLVTAKDIIKKVKLTEKDQDFLNQLATIANPTLVKKLTRVIASGGNLARICDDWLKNNKLDN